MSVIATDTGGLSATSTFALGVLNVNDAPEADTPLANLSTQQDQPFSFSVPASTFSDADFIYGDTLTYSATLADGTVLPVWLSFDVATGTFSGTPLAVNVGNLNVKVSATDTGGLSASSNFALNVNGTDAGAGYSTVTDDGNGNIATAYYDANGNLLSYSMQYSYSYSYSITYDANGKELSSIWQDSNGVSGSSSNTYDAAGNLLSHTWQFDSGDSGSETYDAAGNLLSYSRQYSNGYYYSDTYDATGNRLSSVWHDSNGASGSSSFIYDSAGNLLSYAWQNNSGASGSDTYDSNGNLLCETWQDSDGYSGINIYNADGSRSGSGLNPDGSYYTYTDNGLGEFNELDYGADGMLTGGYWEHADGSYGNDTFNADGSSLGAIHNPDGSYSDYVNDGLGNVHTLAYDSSGALLTDSWTHSNSAPLAGIISDQAATQGALFSYQVPAGSFSDQNVNDTLTLSATLSDGSALPSWLTFDAATQTFSGTPGNLDVGGYSVTVTVTATDTGGLSANSTVAVDVTNVNDAPTVSMAVADQATLEDAVFIRVPGNVRRCGLHPRRQLSRALINGSIAVLAYFDAATNFSGTPVIRGKQSEPAGDGTDTAGQVHPACSCSTFERQRCADCCG